VRDLAGRRPPRATRVALDSSSTPRARRRERRPGPRRRRGQRATRASVGRATSSRPAAERLDRGRRQAPRPRDARGNRDSRGGPGAGAGPRMCAGSRSTSGDDAHFRRHPHRHRGGDLHRGWVWPTARRPAFRQWDCAPSSRPTPHARVTHVARHRQARARARAARDLLRIAPVAHALGERARSSTRGSRADLRGPHRLRHRRVLHQLDADGRPVVAHRVRSRTMPEMRENHERPPVPRGARRPRRGSVLVVEIKRGTLTRVAPDGKKTIVATTGRRAERRRHRPPTAWSTSATTAASSGTTWAGCSCRGTRRTTTRRPYPARSTLPPGQVRGPLQRMRRAGAPRPERHRLRRERRLLVHRPRQDARARPDRTGVFYARADGSRIREVLFPPMRRTASASRPTGAGSTSPRRDRPRLVLGARRPGEVVAGPASPAAARSWPGCRLPALRLLAVDGAGNVCVATLVTGAITVICPPAR